MTGRRHRSNCELVAQGFANIASGLFGGICATGTIARTATNVRAGAHGPLAGMLHAFFLLAFVLIAAPLASYIPLAALAGVLAVVAWTMVEKSAIAALWRSSSGEASVLAITFLLTVFRDLTEAIIVGFALGSVLFIHRISNVTAIETQPPLVFEDSPDERSADRQPYDHATQKSNDAVVYRIRGAFFFGAAAALETVLDRISEHNRVLILDFTDVPFVDSSAAHTIDGIARKLARRDARMILTGTTHDMRLALFAHAIKPPLATYDLTIASALASLAAANDPSPHSPAKPTA
ncbi:MAG: hypothetical protein RLZ98_1843 [Pseudomonadota bacterium]|jgi:SulP family sulfate permease